MSNATPEPKENMGNPEPRIDGRLKVTGEARYGSDFPVANPAYAFLVTSAIARGRIEAMELSEAKAVPGVLEIFYHANSSELKQIEYRSGGGGPTSSDRHEAAADRNQREPPRDAAGCRGTR